MHACEFHLPSIAARQAAQRINLDSASLKHLLAEVVLVLADAGVPSTDGLVLADHDILCDLVEESVE